MSLETADTVRPKRMAATILDMVRSLGLLLVIVAVTLVFVPGLLHPNKSQRFAPASYTDDVAGFDQVTGLRAVVPVGLAKPWYANSAMLKSSGRTAHLHIGWVTPNNDYAGLDESNTSAARFVSSILGAAGLHVTGHEQIAGQAWTQSVSSSGEGSLSRTVNGITIVITGSASPAQQAQLAASLRSA